MLMSHSMVRLAAWVFKPKRCVMGEPVHCRDCGFLALRHRIERRLAEAELETRETGTLPIDPGRQYTLYEYTPICLKRAYRLYAEVEPNKHEQKELVRIINEPRECAS